MKNILKKSIGVLLILITLFFTFTSCDETNTELDDGVKSDLEQSNKESPSCLAAYESDNRVFDIDAVTLTFYYGHDYGKTEEEVEYYINHGISYPGFDLYFEDENQDHHFIRHVDENFISTKYHYTKVYDDNRNIIDVVFNHSETITIPKEVFLKDRGYICFKLRSTNVNASEQKERTVVHVFVWYAKTEDGVIIYNQKEYFDLYSSFK